MIITKMETYEIRYFLAAASNENLQIAAKSLAVSPPAISRAVSRLEDELGVKLFQRAGRNIILTPEGRILQQDANRLMSLLDDIAYRLKPERGSVTVFLCGTEFGISAYLPDILNRLKSTNLKFVLDARILPDTESVERAIVDGMMARGDAKTLVEMARKETDPSMRKVLVERLGAMQNNKDAMDYMMELLK